MSQVDPRTFALIKQRLDEAERNIQYVRQALEGGDDTAAESNAEERVDDNALAEQQIIEGVFDGRNMQGSDGKEYPVPPNYASKSKLVEGDVMKLTIEVDGSFIYKQIQPVERRREVGQLIVDDRGNFIVRTDGKDYGVLLASVTFYKAEEGDEVTILLPENGDAEWGAVENVIHK